MAPQWSAAEDRAFLLALVQAMAPAGPSKHQFEAAVKLANDRWTVSAASQHYNKRLRVLTPLETLEEGGNNVPSTPARSATKRKATTPKSAAAASPSASGRGKKKAPAPPIFPNLKTSEEADGEESDEQPIAKKAKGEVGDGEVEGEEE